MRRFLIRITSIFICILGVQGTFAQVPDYTKPQKYEIGQIEVTGVSFSDPDAIIGVTGLKTGDVVNIPGQKISEAIKALWRLQLFTEIDIIQSKIIDNVVFLEIKLTERPRYTSHTFLGVKRGQKESLDDIIAKHLLRGGIVTENGLNNASNAIENFYREKGYLDAEVSISQTKDEKRQNAVKLIFNVDKKEKVKIKRITFSGIEEKDSRKLRRQLRPGKLRRTFEETKEKRRFLSKSVFRRQDYENDKKLLIDYFNSKGFRDAYIVKDSVWRDDKGEIHIDITVDEGRQYFFRDITWKGNTKYSDAVLSNVLGIKKGQIYNKDDLASALEFSLQGTDVSSLYLDDGYLFFKVDPVEVAVDGDSIDLEMRMYEGPQATIDKVIIRGNDVTHDHVIRRELRTVPGEKFSRADIIRSQRQIINLGYFDPEALTMNTPINPQRGTVDIEYIVSERPNDQLEMSAGWGGISGLIGTLGVTFNNFSARNVGNKNAWRPVPKGDGQRLSLRAQTNGAFFQSYNFSFTEPWLGGKKPTSFTFGAFYTRFTNSFNRNIVTDGSLAIARGFVGLGTRLKWPDDNFVSNTTLTIENISLDDYNNVFRFEGRGISDGSFNNFSITQTIARTTINEPLFPRRGSRISLTIQLTPPYSLFRSDDFYEISDEERALLIARENEERLLDGDPIMSTSEESDFIFGEQSSRRFNFLEYHKWRFDTEWYAPVVGKLVFRASTKMGFLGTYNQNIGVSPFERFELGGDGLNNQAAGITGKDILRLRGYELEEVEDVNSDDAIIFNKFELELRYPFSLNPNSTIFALAFLEGGNSWNRFKDYNPFDLRRAAGAGLRVFLPMFGLLGFDYGFGFDKPELQAQNAPWTDFGKFSLIIGFEPD